METTAELDQELVGEFVIAAHGDAAKVHKLLAQHPKLLNARFERFNETALEAAAHTGQRAIAEHLLEAGAPLTICAAAMLGQAEPVAAMLSTDANLANSAGAHGISVMFHAALSGNVAVAELLERYGGSAGIAGALHGAVAYGHSAMAAWLIERGAAVNQLNYQDKTPLAVALERGDEQMAVLLQGYGGGAR